MRADRIIPHTSIIRTRRFPTNPTRWTPQRKGGKPNRFHERWSDASRAQQSGPCEDPRLSIDSVAAVAHVDTDGGAYLDC